MPTKDKYYVDATINRQNILDTKTLRMKCFVCPLGAECPHAHTAIELDLNPLQVKIRNLGVVMKSESQKLKNDKSNKPWKPCAANFETSGKLRLQLKLTLIYYLH